MKSIYNILFKKIPYFFKNIYSFRKVLWDFRWWDYTYNIEIFRKSLEITEKNIRKKGIEILDHRMKKCDKMKRAIQIMKNIENNNYIEIAENRLNKKVILKDYDYKKISEDKYELINKLTDEENKNNDEIYDLSDKIEKEEWIELWDIMKGKDYSKLTERDNWDEFYDGSGLNTWWD